MTNTQAIIVYRSPAEAMFWESGMAFPLMASLLVFFVVVVALSAAVQNLFRSRKFRNNNYVTWTIMVVGAVAGALTFNYMFV